MLTILAMLAMLTMLTVLTVLTVLAVLTVLTVLPVLPVLAVLTLPCRSMVRWSRFEPSFEPSPNQSNPRHASTPLLPPRIVR